MSAAAPLDGQSGPSQPYLSAHGVKWVATSEPAGKKLSVIRCRSIASATALRTLTSLHGLSLWFMPMYRVLSASPAGAGASRRFASSETVLKSFGPTSVMPTALPDCTDWSRAPESVAHLSTAFGTSG